MDSTGGRADFWVGLREALDTDARGPRARAFRAAQGIVVALAIAALVLGTLPEFAGGYDRALTVFALGLSLFFGLEYVARLFLAGRLGPDDESNTPTRRRLAWMASPLALVDLLAAVAVPTALILGLPHPAARLLGVVWILKAARHNPAFGLIGRVLRNEGRALLSVLVGFLAALLIAATAAHLAEKAAQPEAFGSIPAALWWAIATLTTTGYGDAVPQSAAGRLLSGAVMVCGIGLFALWAGILASAFSQEVRRGEFLRAWDLVAAVPLFQSLGAATIAAVARLLRPVEYGARRTVIRRGQAGDCMFFIADGEVAVELPAGAPPLRLGPGAFFGEMALVTGEARNATVSTLRHTVLLRLDVADFRDLAGNHPDLLAAIENEAAERGGAPQS